jgi:hypothetical protein
MSFTASALSFLLEDLGKTLILTGAQIPLGELRNDAVENLLGSLVLAGGFVIPGQCAAPRQLIGADSYVDRGLLVLQRQAAPREPDDEIFQRRV